jgi:hypothetical protein
LRPIDAAPALIRIKPRPRPATQASSRGARRERQFEMLYFFTLLEQFRNPGFNGLRSG